MKISKLFKYLLLLCFVFSISLSYAKDTVNILIPYVPGGSADLESRELKKILDTQYNYDTNLVFIKSCAQAINEVKNSSENNILVFGSSEYKLDDDINSCPLKSTDPIMPVVALSRIPFYLCNSPNKSYTLNDLASKPITIGVTKSVADYTTYMLKNLKINVSDKVKLVMYRGGGDIVKAATAGDIDMWVSSGAISSLPESKCLGASTRGDIRGIPFIGDFAKDKSFKETYYSTILLTKQTTDKNLLKALESIPVSTKWGEYIINSSKQPIPFNISKVVKDALDFHNIGSW